MHPEKNSTASSLNIEDTLSGFIAAWLSASALMNVANRDVREYFSLRYAGLEGLGLLILLTAGLFAFFLFLQRSKTMPGLDSSKAGRFLYFAWLFFAFTLFQRMRDTPQAPSLLLVMLVSLILARGIFISAAKGKPLDILLCLAGLTLTALVLISAPWPEYLEELTRFSSTSPSYLIPVLSGTLVLIPLLITILWHRMSKKCQLDPGHRSLLIVMITAMVLQAAVISVITVSRYLSLRTPTYDFNLFVQMFHNMAESFQPMTTLERNMPLSHFKVHVSPIYYLMLPFYYLFRDPATLQILQSLVVASGIIPLVFIARHFKLSYKVQIAFSLIYLVSPALIASNFYDLHENCFLPPLILWLIYFLEKRKSLGIAVFTILTLMVKEDAAIYVWTLSLFFMLERKMIKTGLAMLAVSGSWFIAAITWLKEFGDGAMTGRFSGLIGIKEWSLLSVPYSVFRNPGFIFSKLFVPEKFLYILQMLLPLAFMPLLSKKLTRWVLLIPFLLMNLMVDYQYQYDITFQYNYGSYVILMYMALLFFKDLQPDAEVTARNGDGSQITDRQVQSVPMVPGEETSAAFDSATDGKTASKVNVPLPKNSRNFHQKIPIPAKLLLVIAITSGLLFSISLVDGYKIYPRYLSSQQEVIRSIKGSLDEIPSDGSVIATTFLTGYLGEREIIYDLEYHLTGTDHYPADYIVFDLRPGFDHEREKADIFRYNGYRNMIDKPGEVLILMAPWK